MVRGYISLTSNGAVHFSEEEISWARGNLGALRKEKEVILDSFPDNYSRTAYKCNNCNAVLIGGRPSVTQADKVQAAQSEIDKENLKDRIRQMQRF